MDKINLMYHDVFVNKPEESGLASDLYKIDVNTFEKQLKLISDYQRKGWDIALTFDDGGLSFYEPIATLLEKYNLKGLFFIATKYIDEKGFLIQEQIKDLARRGHLIGSHSHTHPENLSSLSKEEIASEWSKSVSILESIVEHSIKVASIPNGYQSKFIFEAALKAGIETLYTSKPTTAKKEFQSMNVYGRCCAFDNI